MAANMSEEKQASLRFCKKCLLRDMTENSYYKNLQEYLEELDEEKKTEDVLYEERLTVCKQCERLVNGLCQACGCYVEMRAAIRTNSCPYDKW